MFSLCVTTDASLFPTDSWEDSFHNTAHHRWGDEGLRWPFILGTISLGQVSSASTSDGKALSFATFLLNCCVNTVRCVLHADGKVLSVCFRAKLVENSLKNNGYTWTLLILLFLFFFCYKLMLSALFFYIILSFITGSNLVHCLIYCCTPSLIMGR